MKLQRLYSTTTFTPDKKSSHSSLAQAKHWNEVHNHNKRVSGKEMKELEALDDEYKDKLQEDSKKWDEWNERVRRAEEECPIKFKDRVKGIKAAGSHLYWGTKDALETDEVVDKTKNPETGRVEYKTRELTGKDKFRKLKNTVKGTRDAYITAREQSKSDRVWKESEKYAPIESDVEKEYREKGEKINKKYKGQYRYDFRI